ncbi:MAG: hypothetical protein QOK35_2169, partial [Pseudonocardiales bacterium]|nr:hypothetical protein [Pseudonocardiales bacterium]
MPQHRSVGSHTGRSATVGEVPGRPSSGAAPRHDAAVDAEPPTEPLPLFPSPSPSLRPSYPSSGGRHAVLPTVDDGQDRNGQDRNGLARSAQDRSVVPAGDVRGGVVPGGVGPSGDGRRVGAG